jgi:hypothetical protein
MIPIGVITRKKIKAMIIGDIVVPSKNPIFMNNLFKIVNISGLTIVIIKNTKNKKRNENLIALTIFDG